MACSALSDAGDSRFHIGGFGGDEWPLDVVAEVVETDAADP
ncbi:hypothetical protein [Streptomyces scopuliridis]